ncbi:Cytochrome c553 [Polaromonas sp. YR568]|uniref:c-type cytochrome n=1 Tax=Polaromonas sp. YR568 TaxID=1855301 RepID=UPI0008E61C97|nr:c-type cytochrome [Polaromonas sp. YR568]SFU97242.1 Cytochrome c553 [Polaromonas sp. YR568]
MNKLFTTIFAVAVSCATAASLAQEIKGDAKAGETKNAMCIGCHGIQGYQASFPEVYKVPMISGQSAKYIVAALNEYKKGDRKHPTMRAIADSLSDQDIADLAAHYSADGAATVAAGQPTPVKAVKEPSAEVKALLNKANCASCHGATFSNPIDPSYPKIGGQHADYLFVALKAYKVDNNPKVGRSNAIMAGMAKQYTNPELKLLANYLSSVDGDLKTIPQKKFR